MARLQLLELPEGTGDDRPPFILVVDQWTNPFHGQAQQWAEQIGARAVLVFEETIDIPANDTNKHLAEAGVWTTPDELRAQIQEEIAKAQAELIDVLNRQAQR